MSLEIGKNRVSPDTGKPATLQLGLQRDKYPFIYIAKCDEETKRRLNLPPLVVMNPYKGRHRIASVDDEGRVYQLRWNETKGMSDKDEVISPKHLRGKIYIAAPGRKKIIRVTPHYFKAGIDVALRSSEKVGRKYKLAPHVNSGDDNFEGRQMVEAYYQFRRLRLKLLSFKGLGEDEINKIAADNTELLESIKMNKPRMRDKLRIRNSLARGFRDKSGRKNYLAAYSRIFSTELALRRQLQEHFPHVVLKYGANSEVLRYERERSRLVLSTVAGDLEGKQTLKSLRQVSEELLAEVLVRPYILPARKAVELIGLSQLPEGSMSDLVQKRDSRLGLETVFSLISKGDVQGARDLLERIRSMLIKVLDLHEDYHTVKPSA